MPPIPVLALNIASLLKDLPYQWWNTLVSVVPREKVTWSNRSECQHCGRRRPSECRINDRACFKCGSHDHFIWDCPEMVEKDKFQSTRLNNTTTRGRLSRNMRNGASRKGMSKDSAMRSEVRAPRRTYAIRACEDASSLDVIMGTCSLYGTNIIALIDLGSTHSYICMNLVSSKKFLAESTEFVIKVLNSLGKSVLVDKVKDENEHKVCLKWYSVAKLARVGDRQSFASHYQIIVLGIDDFNILRIWHV
ncbi:Gag-Pol polyprotein [Gossypium arboreum]|uniref:Gag-Pol polyprotein n=1 Tax=Gossypium arboreum TaxID=29729 RepID=A0A0B0NIH9_GOSAR|nr:Gag-Pol polyprotein [Gossypium arboreum]